MAIIRHYFGYQSRVNPRKKLYSGRSNRNFIKRFYPKGRSRNPYGFREY